MNKFTFWLMNLVAILLFFSCVPRTVTPLRTIPYEHSSPKDGLLIYMPGMGDSITVLQANGIIDSLQHYAPMFDVVTTDVHIGYYIDRTLHERLTEDIIKPAQAAGYRHIWFLGNSMGGVGSQIYAWKHPGIIEGIILMGPYTTSKKIIREIEKADGLATWSLPNKTKEKDWERQLWHWHKSCLENNNNCPQIYITYGKEDKLAPGIHLLEQILPKDHVVAVEGGHDWPEWKEGLMQLLRTGVLEKAVDGIK